MRREHAPAFTTFDSFHRFLLHVGRQEHFSFFPSSCDTRRGGDGKDKQGWRDGRGGTGKEQV